MEDNPGDARLVQEMLADAAANSFRVHTADCLVGALDSLVHGKFDAALVDLSLPDSNGLETLLTLDRVARQHCPSPLHRHAQTTTHLLPASSKPDISTLQRIGHFYFALTLETRL
ncbi:MAG: response regulator [Bryobacteraceae bacterium]